MKTRADFARDFKAWRKGKKFSLQKVADHFDISNTAVMKWEDPEEIAFPSEEKWEGVYELSGLHPRDYQAAPAPVSISQSIGNISAIGNATVTASNVIDAIPAMLTPMENEILLLFRRYGSQAMMERCLNQLRAQAAMFG